MFTVKAGYTDQVELDAPLERVREFFADLANFAALMPGVAQVVIDRKGIAHWDIETIIPVVGSMRQRFMLELAEDTEDRIEWFPIREETRNFLRFSADFLARSSDRTMVQFTQMVEMRRQNARDLHTLAGLAGETIINNEMTRRVTEMIQVFITRAKEKLEK